MALNKGKVWLVGAGPSDAGLLTVKGKKVTENADVIVYDHLIGKEILSMLDDTKSLINVGKRAGYHPIPQEEISQILVREAQKGKKVVRLKGGDPFVFGRGGEELQELNKQGIPFEVVPGVSSALAVPAYCGIPVTHRGLASSVHIITGHKRAGEKADIPYEALVNAGGTFVFLMGVTALPEIQRGLLDGGMSPDVPAAVLQEGTSAGQKRIDTTVGELETAAKAADIRPPAIIIAGEVCSLAQELAWYEKLPLHGMRVVLTRPRELQSVLAGELRSQGAQVLELPAIDTVLVKDKKGFCGCLAQIESYDWIVFTSQTGVRIFFEQMLEEQVDVRRLSQAKFAVIGEGTAKALKEKGIYPDLMPKVYDGDSLAEAIAKQGIAGQKILIPRAKKGNMHLVPVLEQAGAKVKDLAIYETVHHKSTVFSIKEELTKEPADCVVFTSASTVEGFVEAAGEMEYTKLTAVCIGKQTAAAAQAYGMQCYVAEKAALDALVEQVQKVKVNKESKKEGTENDKKTKKIKTK